MPYYTNSPRDREKLKKLLFESNKAILRKQLKLETDDEPIDDPEYNPFDEDLIND